MAFSLATAIVTLAGNRAPLRRELQSAERDTRNFAQRAGDTFKQVLSTTIGTATGVILANVFQAGAQAIKSAGQSAFRATADYEMLTLGIQNLVARELRAADSTLTMAEALEKAAPRAEELLYWIEQLAISSPFDQASIAAIFRQAQAYGFAGDEAQRLTRVIVDFAAGSGQSIDAGQRIALALGQIQNRGKLAAEEINQLVDAGIPVRAILADAFGVTTAQLGEMVQKGLVPADRAILAIVESLERDFAGAAERSQGTLNGLINSMQDLAQIALRDLFGPSFQAAQGRLSELVSAFNSPETRQKLQAIGEFVGRGVGVALDYLTQLIRGANQMVKGWISSLANMERGTARSLGRVGGFFVALARQAVSWGVQIVGAIAAGIASATNLIVRSLAAIGRTLSFWLRPSSPPKIAPDLDIWGQHAMEEYLAGWANADFSTFLVVGRLIEQELARAASAGGDSLDTLTDSVIATQDALVVAVNELHQTGTVTEETLASVTAAAGDAAEPIDELTRLYLEWEAASLAVRQAQQSLASVSTSFDDQLAALREGLTGTADELTGEEAADRIRELEEALTDTTLTAEERAALQAELEQIRLGQKIRALEAEKAAAIAVEQEKLKAAEAAEDAALLQLRVYEQQLEAQQKQARLLEEQMRLMEQMAISAGSLAGSLGDVTDPLQDQLRGLQLQQAELQAIIRLAELQKILEDEKATAAQKAAAELEKQTIETERQIRAAEAAELGVSLADVQAVEIDPRDLGAVTNALDAQVASIELQQQYLDNLIGQAQARAILEDETATAAERAAAALDLQRLQLEQMDLRDRAAELGVDLAPLEGIPIVLEDISGKAVEVDEAMAGAAESASSLAENLLTGITEAEAALGDDPFGLGELQTTIDEFNKGFGEGGTAFADFASNFEQAIKPLTEVLETLFGKTFTVVEFGEVKEVHIPGLIEKTIEAIQQEGLVAGIATAVRESDFTPVATELAKKMQEVLLGTEQRFDIGEGIPIVVQREGLVDRLVVTLETALQEALNRAFSRTEAAPAMQFEIDLSDLWTGGIILPEDQHIDRIIARWVGSLELGKKFREAIGVSEEADTTEIGKAISSMLATAFGKGIGGVLGFIGKNVTRWIQDMFSRLAEGFTVEGGTGNQLETAIETNLGQIINRALFNVIENQIRPVGAALQVGVAIIDGINEGVTGGESTLSQTVSNTVDNILGWFRQFLRIESPSGLMRDEVGVSIPEGIAVGMRSRFEEVRTAVTELIAELTNSELLANFYQAGIAWVDNLRQGFSDWWDDFVAEVQEQLAWLNSLLGGTTFEAPAFEGGGGGSGGFGTVPEAQTLAVDPSLLAPTYNIEVDASVHDVTVRNDAEWEMLQRRVENMPESVVTEIRKRNW